MQKQNFTYPKNFAREDSGTAMVGGQLSNDFEELTFRYKCLQGKSGVI